MSALICMANQDSLVGCCENNVARWRVGYPTKDNQGNAIDSPEGIVLEVQWPGTTTFVQVASCIYPEDLISWDITNVLDGNYIGQMRAFTYRVHCGGKAACPQFGPPCAKFAIPIKKARPGSPPQPVELQQDCCQTTTVAGAPSVTMA